MSLHSESRHARRGWRGYWILLILTSATVYFSSNSETNSLLNRAPRSMVAPLSLTANYVGAHFKDSYSVYFDNVQAASELTRARQEIENLKSQRLEFQQLKREVLELRTQLEFSETRKDLDLIPATILARGPSEFSKRLTIRYSKENEGQVQVGAPVVSAEALIGQILRVDEQEAEVMLLSDPRSAVDIRLSKSGTRGVAVGLGQAKNFGLQLKYVNQEQTIQDDEILLTSGKDGKFPRGLPVGRIKKLDEVEVTQVHTHTIVPPSNLDDIHYIFIVRGRSGISADGSGYEEKD